MFSLNPFNATPTQQLNPSGRTTRSVKIIAAVIVVLLAADNRFASAAENSTRTAREHHACAVIMGLHQPGDLYNTCIRSLDKSLSELDQAELVSTDRSRCALEGLTPGTPALAVCVVDAERSPADAGRNSAIAAVRRSKPSLTRYTPWIGDYNVPHHLDLLSCNSDGRMRQCDQERQSDRLGAGAPGLRRRRHRPGQPRFRSVCLRSLLLAIE